MAWAAAKSDPLEADDTTAAAELGRLVYVQREVVEDARSQVAARRTYLVRTLRDVYGWTWREVAEAAGMTQSRCRQVYQGQVPVGKGRRHRQRVE